MTTLVAFGSTVIGIAALGFWIRALVEVARIPEWQFDAAASNKLFWSLVIGLINVPGALLWHFTTRERVFAAGDDWDDVDDPMDDAPAGWYGQPGAAALRWWDGSDWTDRYNTWSGAPS